MNNSIKQFFSEYEKRFEEGLRGEVDPEQAASVFTDNFLEASPVGVVCGKNDEKFKKAIPEGYNFYKSIGTKSMKIKSLDITHLDDLHHMVKVFWSSLYDSKKDKKEIRIDFEVIYFLQQQNEKLKIFSYITGDEQKVLKEHGLLPEQKKS